MFQNRLGVTLIISQLSTGLSIIMNTKLTLTKVFTPLTELELELILDPECFPVHWGPLLPQLILHFSTRLLPGQVRTALGPGINISNIEYLTNINLNQILNKSYDDTFLTWCFFFFQAQPKSQLSWAEVAVFPNHPPPDKQWHHRPQPLGVYMKTYFLGAC